jgi:ABC-2 type transport system ATP-binding protein
VVFQDPAVDDMLTGRENLDFHGRMYGLDGEERRERINEVLELVDLTDKADVKMQDYSGGMQRRLEIARGLMHHPHVLFLDEPTLGLDAQTRRHIWQYIKEMNRQEGVTIILTTHYMEEADRLCSRVAIIDHGKIIALDTPQNLKDGIGGDVVTIRSPQAEAIPDALQVPWISHLERHDGAVTISLQNAEQHIPGIVSLLHGRQIVLESLSLHKPTLEDVFLSFTGKTIREEEADGKASYRMYQKMMRR